MEKIVYFLGAGFSAGLNYPLMSNFLERAKDIYFQDSTTYRHFVKVFKSINKLSALKNYFASDLSNIEEILSLLESKSHFTRSFPRKHFISFLEDVIKYYTPKLKHQHPHSSASWFFQLINDQNISDYLIFILSTLNANITYKTDPGIGKDEAIRLESNEKSIEYTFITLNYDLLIEELINFLNKFAQNSPISVNDKSNNFNLIYLKLHGSVDKKNIIPPTWNKNLIDKNLLNDWRISYQKISEANHIRFIGFSMPETDSYIKYLFKAAITHNSFNHLKYIDVICLDDSEHSVENRYREFIKFNKLRFINKKFSEYLRMLSMTIKDKTMRQLNDNTKNIKFDSLELVHQNFFKNI